MTFKKTKSRWHYNRVYRI